MYITAMVRIRPETALEIFKKNRMILFFSWKEKRKHNSFFQGIETSIPFLGKKQKNFKSIDFKRHTYMEQKHIILNKKTRSNRSCGLVVKAPV